MKTVKIGNATIGAQSSPAMIIAEIGINHNGDLSLAKKLVDAAFFAGCDAVKFQKRTPEKCVPLAQRDLLRETPWGIMTYLDYRKRVEFGPLEYAEIDEYCKGKALLWFASCWDEDSVDFLAAFNPPCFKIPSALLTNDNLLRKHREYKLPVILSTGMSTLEQVDHAIEVLGSDDLVLLHTNSAYPSRVEDLNLRAMCTLRERYQVPVGYSGHEVGLATTVAAVVMGACMVERHITLDRAMWGTDQAASVEPYGFHRLVRDIRAVELSMGDGEKKISRSELEPLKRLRGS